MPPNMPQNVFESEVFTLSGKVAYLGIIASGELHFMRIDEIDQLAGAGIHLGSRRQLFHPCKIGQRHKSTAENEQVATLPLA